MADNLEPASSIVDTRDWRAIKPIFIRLYKEEDKPLKVVQEILEKKYHFAASLPSFKRRAKKWGVIKNYKAKEKERLAQLRDKLPEQAGDSQDSGLNLKHRPVKWHRVDRFERMELHKRLRQERASITQTNPDIIGWQSTPPKSIFTDRSEKILNRTQELTRWQLSIHVQSFSTDRFESYGMLFLEFNRAVLDLNAFLNSSSRSPCSAWQGLDEICASLLKVVPRDPWIVWHVVLQMLYFRHCTDYDWLAGMLDHLFSYVRALVLCHVSAGPLQSLLIGMDKKGSSTSVVRQQSLVVHDTLMLTAVEARNDYWHLLLSSNIFLVFNLHRDEALMRMLSQYRDATRSSDRQWHLPSHLEALGEMEQQQYEKATQICHEGLGLCAESNSS